MAAPINRISSKMPHDDWVRCFDVSEPQKHDKGYTVYKVNYKMYSRKTAELADEIVIWKRYNDFKKLYKILSEWHRKLQRREEFPLFARAKVFGRFEEAVIEERRQSAFDLLAFAGCQYHLYNHKAFKLFFEGGQHVNSDAAIDQISPIQPDRAWSAMSRDESHDSLATDASESDNPDGGRSSEQRGDEGLGGVWQFRQANDDNISLESAGTEPGHENDDDDTSYTDDSALTTPLPDNDLTFFDPLRRPSVDDTGIQKGDNTWLLSAMSICAELDSNSATPSPVHRMKNEDESESEGGASGGGMKLSATMEEIANRTRAGTGESVSKMDIGGSDDYIYQAARQISTARDCEANAQYSLAFDYYKTGVGILLTGVQDDSNKARREAVRKKTAQYLLKAEDLHNNFLRTSEEQQWTAEVCLSSYRNLDPTATFLQGSVSELGNYRVLGVIDTVMLVLDKNTENTYIMKTLHKSTCSAQDTRTIIPQNVPYMVKLYRFYDTDCAIFLLLQHATGGKLWNYISAYLNHYNEDRTGLGDGTPLTDNIYAGQKLQSQETELIEKAELKIRETESKKELDFEYTSEYEELVETYRRDLVTDTTSPSNETASCLGDQNETESEPIVKAVAMETDVEREHGACDNFESTLEEHKNSRPAVGLFSINSIDSSDNEHHTSVSSETDVCEPSSTVRLELEDIPENDAISDNITDIDAESEQKLPSTDELVHNSKQLLKSVSQTLNEEENELSHDAPDVVRSAILPRRSSTPSDDVFRTSSILGVEISTERTRTSSTSSDGEECIYDLNGRKSPQTSPGKTSSPVKSSARYCPPAQRKRNFSTVFREFDDMLARTNMDVKMPEVCVKQWAAEIFLALDRLHYHGVICRDLNPTNILLGDRGHVMLSYFSEWTNVHRRLNQEALNYNYCAPEVRSFYNVDSKSCDWWSFGAILYELLTCKSLYSCHTSGINSHTQLNIPDHVSAEAQDLLRELLRYNATERLGSGIGGADDIRHHHFFVGIDWTSLQTMG